MKHRIYPNLEAFFRETGTTQAALAAKLGVTQSHISMIRARKRTPGPALLLKLAHTAHIPVEALLTELSVREQ